MTKKYEVHTHIEMKVASFIYADSEDEAISIASQKDAGSFLQGQILDISTINIQSAFKC